jgi:hypothetical protein
MHESIEKKHRIYGLFNKNDLKERLHSQGRSEEIKLIEKIPPEDREFVLDLYRLYKEKKTK